jgi:release factor glutamine methyltransferase
VSETQTIRSLLQKTREWFVKKGIESARLDAELLLAHALSETRLKLYMDLDRPLKDDEVARFRELVKRRGTHEPVAYIVGTREFFGTEIAVGPGVLVPRPETEHVVEEALARLADDATGTVVDVCTGSGCVAIAIALARPHLRVIAIDIDDDALAHARANVERHALGGRVEVRAGDLLAPVASERSVRAVVGNPPYVTRSEYGALMPDVRCHEPERALVGEDADGLGHHRRILAEADAILDAQGFVALEIGADQGDAVRSLSRPGLLFSEVVNDLAGLPRIAIFSRESAVNDAGTAA